MKTGILVTGVSAVRAAHSLAAHPGIDEVVVIGPATSKNYRVVDGAEDCDFLVGAGPDAPARAIELGAPLIWDGPSEENGVVVWGASPAGLALALAAREPEARTIAVAHPDLEAGSDHRAVFPKPVGKVAVSEIRFGNGWLTAGQSPNQYAAVLVAGPDRRVTMVDDGAFMSGIALAAGAAVLADRARPVWDDALDYLQAASAMGLVMAEEVTSAA